MLKVKPRFMLLRGKNVRRGKVKDAYWVIFRDGLYVEVFDEIRNRPVRRLSRTFSTVEKAEAYITDVLGAYRGRIAIFDRM